MGWTSYYADTINGKVDRKAEVDKLYTQNEQDGTDYNGMPYHYPQMRIVKSIMKGCRWYGVVEVNDSVKGTSSRFAQIVLTSTKWFDGMNFGYKDIGSYYSGYLDFPKNMLRLLSDPECEEDKKWREDCLKSQERRQLAKLPVGTVIAFIDPYSGEEKRLYKHEPAYQFKKPFWAVIGENRYVSKKKIPDDFEIIAG